MRKKLLLVLSLVFSFLLVLVVAWAEQVPDEVRFTDLNMTKKLLAQGDTYLVLDYMQGGREPREIAEAYERLVKDLYWKDKNVADMVIAGRFGIAYCLTKAYEYAGQAERYQFMLARAKTLAYNLASFTWPGWEEPGIVISTGDLEAGLDAARLNLRLALKIRVEPIKISVAYWMLGAQWMSHKKYDEAIAAFNEAKKYAGEASDRENEWLNEGFLGIALMMQGKKQEGRERFDRAVAALEASDAENASFFAKQLKTALSHFQPH